MTEVTRLDDGLWSIDLEFQGERGVIAAYLVADGGEWVLVEIGPTSTLDTLLAGLRQIDVDPAAISKVLVTHVHLDHAGAAGTFLRRFPGARLYVHEIGAPHLVDPSKLLTSATRIYGDMMGPLWGDVEPVPAHRVTTLADGDTVGVGGRRLGVAYTPGHASHHVAFHDAERGAVFTGDVAAVRLQGFDFVRPPTPPPDLDLELWTESLSYLRRLAPRVLYLTHFGPFRDVDRHLEQTQRRLYEWAAVLWRGVESGQVGPALVDMFRLHGDGELLQTTGDASAVARYELATPYDMSVSGYLRHFKKSGRLPAVAP